MSKHNLLNISKLCDSKHNVSYQYLCILKNYDEAII